MLAKSHSCALDPVSRSRRLDMDEWMAQEDQRKRKLEEKAAAAGASGAGTSSSGAKDGRKSLGSQSSLPPKKQKTK